MVKISNSNRVVVSVYLTQAKTKVGKERGRPRRKQLSKDCFKYQDKTQYQDRTQIRQRLMLQNLLEVRPRYQLMDNNPQINSTNFDFN